MFKKKFLYISVVLLFMITALVPTSHVFGQEETQEPCEGRRASGDGSMIPFCAGEEVFGVDIYLSTGESCEGGSCWLPSAPVSGEVRTGVVNPWDGEVPGGIEPWNPYPPTETPIPTSTPTETSIPTQTPPEPTPTETGECQNPQGNHETHPPDGNTWSPQGSWRTVRLWIPGHPTYGSDHKLFLGPNDNVGIVNGAGSSWSWNVGCGDIAWENYQAIGDPEVTLQELRDAGLIEEGEPPIETPTPIPTVTITPPDPTSTPEEPVVCNNPDHPEPRAPIRGQYWEIGPFDGWSIVEMWTNEPGHDQGLRAYWLQPDETLNFLGGGSLWIWPQGCRDVAWENFQANPLPKVTYDELASEGLIFEPTVCQEPEVHQHDPVQGQYWSIGPFDGWTIVQLWTNEPGYPQDLRVYWLQPGEILNYLGGGTLFIWPHGCRDAAWESYQESDLPRVTYEELSQEGLLFEPAVCTIPDQPESHTPIQGQYWQIGPYNGWTIVELWTNEPGYDQGLRAYWLQPDETLNFLGGGSLWIWPQGCRDVAWENFQANPLPKVTYDELASEGLILLPEEETLEVVNQEVTLFTPLDFIEPGTIMPEPLSSETTIIVEDSPNEEYQAVQNGGNLTIQSSGGNELDLGIKCAQVEWLEDWTILCRTEDGKLILTDRLKTFERSIVDDATSIEDISSDGEWIKYTDTHGDTWVVSIHGWHFGHASPDAWWVASAFSP